MLSPTDLNNAEDHTGVKSLDKHFSPAVTSVSRQDIKVWYLPWIVHPFLPETKLTEKSNAGHQGTGLDLN